MGYIVEYKEEEYNEVVEKVKQAKKCISEAMELLEDGNSFGERGSYRGSYRNGGYREGSYRDEEYEDDQRMNMRRRNSRGRYM